MQIFELHFNPENRRKIIETFCHQPENIYEKRLGALCIAGELIDPEAINRPFLENLSYKTKATYHAIPTRSPEEAFQEALRDVNSFLGQEIEKENNQWVGKMNVAILSIKENQLNFSKIGNIRILLFRNRQIIDIGEKMGEDIPKEVFGSVVTGKIKEEDKVLVISENIYQSFSKLSLIEKIGYSKSLSEDKIEEMASLQNEKYPRETGICLIIDFSLKNSPVKRSQRSKKKEVFSFKKVFLSLLLSLREIFFITLKKIREIIPKIIEKIKDGMPYLKAKLKNLFSFLKVKVPKRKKKEKKKKEIKLPSLKLPSFKVPPIFKGEPGKRNLILFSLFFIIIILGSFISHLERRERIEEQESFLREVEGRVERIDLEDKESIPVLKEIAKDLYQIPLGESLLKEVEGHLYNLSKTTFLDLSDPYKEITSFSPKRILYKNDTLFLFDKKLTDFKEIDLIDNREVIRPISIEGEGIYDLIFSGDTIFFYVGLDKIVSLEGRQEKIIILTPPYSNYSFLEMEAFGNYLYFLEKDQIIRYQKGSYHSPESWMEERLIGEMVSFSIDGSIWVMEKEGDIHKYHGGAPQESFSLSLYPALRKPERLITKPDTPLIVFDPKEKRIVILSKEGELIEQIIFNTKKEIKDITFSREEKKIYLLLDKEVYEIKVNF